MLLQQSVVFVLNYTLLFGIKNKRYSELQIIFLLLLSIHSNQFSHMWLYICDMSVDLKHSCFCLKGNKIYFLLKFDLEFNSDKGFVLLTHIILLVYYSPYSAYKLQTS